MFGLGTDAFGLLLSSVGLGAVLGGLWLAQRGHVQGLTRIFLAYILILACVLILFTVTDYFYFAVVCVFIAGFAQTVAGTGEHVLIQAAVDELMRGRVVSLYGAVSRGTPALGALVMGWAGDQIGLRLPIAGGRSWASACGPGPSANATSWPTRWRPRQWNGGLGMAGTDAIRSAMASRNYRNYAIGSFASHVGTWVQRVAVGWLAWELTHSGLWLGMIAFADLAPTVFLAPVCGVVADRVDRLHGSRVTQSLAALQAFSLWGMAIAGWLTIEWLFCLVLVQGVIMAFNQPLRFAIIPSLVEHKDLGSAIAINSISFNFAGSPGRRWPG